MKIIWLDDALDDLKSIRNYIAIDDPSAASEVVKKILHIIEVLPDQPGIGRPGRVHHTRELVISGTPFIVPYRIKRNTVEILRVFHSSMQWPEIM